MKRIIPMLLVVFLSFGLSSCGQSNKKINEDVLSGDWETIVKSAKGTTVNFYGWGGDERTNKWIDTYLAKRVKDEYGITLNRVPMNIDDILNKLLGEKQVNAARGTTDMVWINGENFFAAKKNGLLYGPFSGKLPNYNKYVNKDSLEVKYDFGFPVEEYEAPYGKAQFVMIYDRESVKKAPANYKELLEFVKNNPGKFTYTAPPDFTGSAFVRNIIYEIAGHEQFTTMKADRETVEKAVMPAINFLKEIKPYLWKEGKTYPATIAQLDNMYSDKEVLMSISYNPNHAAGKIQTGEFQKSTDTFVFDKGTIGNTHFLAVPYNSPNKAGAMVVINTILSPDTQASKYDPKNWGDLPVLDNDKLNDSEKKLFNDIKLGPGAIPQAELLKRRVPEMPANIIPIIEQIWLENIPVER